MAAPFGEHKTKCVNMVVTMTWHRAGAGNIAGTIETVRDLNKEANEWLDGIGTKFKPFNPTVEKVRAKRKAKLEVDDAWETLIQSVIAKIPIREEAMMTRPQIMKTTRIGEKDKKNYIAFVLFAEIAERPDVVTVHKDGKPHYFRAA